MTMNKVPKGLTNSINQGLIVSGNTSAGLLYFIFVSRTEIQLKQECLGNEGEFHRMEYLHLKMMKRIPFVGRRIVQICTKWENR